MKYKINDMVWISINDKESSGFLYSGPAIILEEYNLSINAKSDLAFDYGVSIPTQQTLVSIFKKEIIHEI